MPDIVPSLVRAAPYLPVPDVGRATEYYRSVLGFEVAYVGGAPPEFAIVERGAIAIMFRGVGDAKIVPNEQQGGTWDVFVWVRGVGELAQELRQAGAEVVYGPVTMEQYGMVEFAVRDPFGYVLGFGEPVAPER